MGINEKKDFIMDQLGPNGIEMLRVSGIDVEAAISRVLQAQEKEHEKLELQADFPGIEDRMTSELVYLSANPKDVFGREYTRRMGLLGFSEDQIRKFFSIESLILASDILTEDRKALWATRYFFRHDTRRADLPKPEQLTMSELTLITDDANSAYIRDHHVIGGEAWAAVCRAAIQAYSFGGAQYAIACRKRVESLGWSTEQGDAYVKNDCLQTERLKWGHHNKPSWTPETTNLSLYGR